MTDEIYFDTDCLSSFLIIGKRFLLTRLFAGRIILPAICYQEILRAYFLRSEFTYLIKEANVDIRDFDAGTPEYQLYYDMTQNRSSGLPIIGRGEAAALSMAKYRKGILASNNYADVKIYVDRYGIRHLSTDKILKLAMDNGLIDEKTGNSIWRDMVKRGVNMPPGDFTDFLIRTKL